MRGAISWPGWLRSGRVRYVVAGGLAACALAALVVVWLLPDDRPEPRERRYRDVTACLLTGQSGLSSTPAAAVWAGMQDASQATLVKVQYLAVPGEQTPQNAMLYLNSLGQGGCAVILAVGEVPVRAVADAATRFPDIRFIAIGGDASVAPNMSSVDLSADVRTTVGRLVASAVGTQPDD